MPQDDTIEIPGRAATLEPTMQQRTIGLTALAILIGVAGANAFFNHTSTGAWLKAIPGLYPVVFYVGLGVALPAWFLGRIVRSEHTAARDLGVGAGRRDAIAVVAALCVGSAFAAVPLASFLRDASGWSRLATLFAQLLVASTAEAVLFLGVLGAGLGAFLGRRNDWRTRLMLVVVSCVAFGLFHFTYPSPWNTGALALTVGIIWIGVSTLFVASRSLLAAIVLNNVMAVIGFAQRGLVLPLPAPYGWLLAVLALAVFSILFISAQRSVVRPATKN